MARRMRGEGSVYQREDGLWVARVEVGVVNGVRKRKVVYGKTQREAVRKLAEVKKAVAAGDTNTAGTTVEKWLDYWLEHVCPGKPRMKPKTLRNYRSYVERHLVPALGRKRLDRLAVADVRALNEAIIAKGLSSTTAHHAYRILHTALQDAMTDGKVTRNVASLVSAPPKAASATSSLTLEQFRDLMRRLDGDRLQSRWAFGLFTGARQGECLGLTWDNLDLVGGVADLAWQLQRIPYRHGCDDTSCGRRPDRCPARELAVHPGFEYRRLDGNLCLQRPKTKGSTRVVALPEMLVVALRERHALYQAERRHYRHDHGLVWARLDGRPIDGRVDWVEWAALLADLDIGHMPLHAGRHTSSTIMGALKVPENVRMSILGHSEAATNRLYSHVDLSQQREAMETYGSAVASLLTRPQE